MSKPLKSKVQRWLMADGWKIREEKKVPDANWVLSCTDEGNRILMIGQPKGKADLLSIQTKLLINGEGQQEKLGEMQQHERNEFYIDLIQSLLLMNVEYMNIQDPFESVELVLRIYEDGLTKDALIERISRVRNALVLVATKLAKLTNKPPPPEQPEKHMGFHAKP